MSRTNFVFLLILFNISSIFTEVNLTSTSITTITTILTSQEIPVLCTYCQTKACRCSTMKNSLNCSSYLLNLTFDLNCAEIMIWETVDFSSRNLEYFDSTKLLSLRMQRLLLKSNLISNIFDNTFDSIGNILIELDFEMNQLSHISSKWLNSKLNQLKIFNLASNQLESLNDLDNIQLSSLQQLNLSCNQFEIFPKQIQQWTSLIKLDLSFNKLSNIPRFSFVDLQNLRWLSLASNRRLNCLVQDSFKYLKSLTYLEISSTNLFNLDACIFIQLSNLKILKIERVSINCSSCWLSIAKKNSIELSGQCLNNITIQRLNTLTNQQLENSCSKTSIDCSRDYCEPGSFNSYYKSSSLDILSKSLNTTKNRTIEIILGVIFSIIALIVIIVIIVLIYRWKKGRSLFCFDFLLKSSTKQRQQHTQIIDTNPTIIESVVTHGANMNIPPYSHHAYGNNKRKLYNPMFTDTPRSELSLSNNSSSYNNSFEKEMNV